MLARARSSVRRLVIGDLGANCSGAFEPEDVYNLIGAFDVGSDLAMVLSVVWAFWFDC